MVLIFFFKISLATAAKCHLKLGNWSAAIRAAEMVISMDKKCAKAILVKAEALFNICQFEHALVFFYRGQALLPESEDFRLGIQKCRKESYNHAIETVKMTHK